MINILKISLTYEWWNGLAEFQPNRQYSKRVFNIDILGRKCCYKWYILTLFMRILTFCFRIWTGWQSTWWLPNSRVLTLEYGRADIKKIFNNATTWKAKYFMLLKRLVLLCFINAWQKLHDEKYTLMLTDSMYRLVTLYCIKYIRYWDLV